MHIERVIVTGNGIVVGTAKEVENVKYIHNNNNNERGKRFSFISEENWQQNHSKFVGILLNKLSIHAIISTRRLGGN